MKRTSLLLSTVALMLSLASCSQPQSTPSSSSSISSQTSITSEESMSSEESQSSEKSSETEPFVSSTEGSSVTEESSSNIPTSEGESSSSSSLEPVQDTTIDVYATNDFHGQVYSENPTSRNGRMGLGVMATYLLNQKEDNPYTLLLDQGDTWQGSIYSNLNYGALITDIMNYVGYDARTVGNHDFDWGLDPIIENGLRDYEGYSTPVLAANVYDFDFVTKTEGENQRSDIGIKSITKTFDTGCKVGVVGVIGSEQITSISSIYVHDICFKDHIAVAVEEAKKLRNDGCDVVILSVHAGQASIMGFGLDKYFDLALCGHTHRNEISYDGSMPIAQFGSYSSSIGHVKIEFDGETRTVSVSRPEALSSSTITSKVTAVDSVIEEMIEDNYELCENLSSEILVQRCQGYFDKNVTLPNLMCKAIYDEAIEEGYDIDFSYCNEARHYRGNSSRETTWTYADIYESFPFDNTVYIIEATAEEVKSEVLSWNSICKDPNESITIEEGRTYKIACIDFLAFHTNASRYYDFFPSVGDLSIDETPSLEMNYRHIISNWLRDQGYNEVGGPILDADDFDSGMPSFNKAGLVVA